MKSKKSTPKKAAKKPAAKAVKPAAKKVAKDKHAKLKAVSKKIRAAAADIVAAPMKKAVQEVLKKQQAQSVEQIHELKLTDIETGANYRTVVVDDNLKELSASIKAQGLIQPITVKPIADKPGKFLLIAGERRYKASELADFKTIRSIIRITESNADTRVVQLIENLQREDVNPMDEAIAFYDLTHVSEAQKAAGQKKPDYTPDTLATAIGKSRSYIFKRMKLRELCAKGQEWFRKDYITYHHALVLARIEEKVQEDALLWLVKDRTSENNVLVVLAVKTVEELQRYLLDDMAIDIDQAPFDLKDEQLLEGVTSCDKCPLRTCNNKELLDMPRGHMDEGEDIDKCTNKFCFGRKVDAHRQQRIDETTKGNKGEPLKKISVAYRYVSSTKIDGVEVSFSDKKSAEKPDAVLITKQGQGFDLIGKVVYVNLDFAEKKKEIVANAGGVRRLTNNDWELENKRKALVNEYKFQAVENLSQKLFAEELGVPAISDEEILMPLTDAMICDTDDIASAIAAAFLQKITGKKPDAVKILLQEITNTIEDSTDEKTMVDLFKDNYPDLVKSIHKVKEPTKIMLLRLLLADKQHSNYNTNPRQEPFYVLMKECGVKAPEKAEDAYVEKGMKPAAEAPQEEVPTEAPKKKAAKQKDLLEEIEEVENEK